MYKRQILGRARLFEVVQRIRQVNRERVRKAPGQKFTGTSHFIEELNQHPELGVDYIVAPPRMAFYMDYSTRIYDVYQMCIRDRHTMYHMPAFPMIPIADAVNRKKAGYGLDDCNAAREVRKAKVPILFIHGDSDSFVPCHMCEELYENCASQKMKLIVKGAGHCESYYKETEQYEKALDELCRKGAIN